MLIMTKPSNPVKFLPPASFETALAELGKHRGAKWKQGNCRWKMSLLAHKRGMELLQYCQFKLQDAQQQVRITGG